MKGIYPVFQTPYNNDFSIDFDTLATEIDWLFENGVQGITMAMVSETLRLSSEERDELATKACEFAGDRGGAVISVGAESTHTAIRYARHAEAARGVNDDHVGSSLLDELGGDAGSGSSDDDGLPLGKGVVQAGNNFFARVGVPYSSPFIRHGSNERDGPPVWQPCKAETPHKNLSNIHMIQSHVGLP